MTQYRTIIKPTDPRVNIKLPNALYHDLKAMATSNVRRFSEEVLARLLATMAPVEQLHTEQRWVESDYHRTNKR